MYRRCLLAAAAGLLLAGCGDVSSPAGSSSAVAIRAFVDADGSGAFAGGDVPIAGLAITLKATSGSATFSATTDAQGVASFAAVPPGSYTATLSGNPPAGAVLATAESPVLVAPLDGSSLTGEFRFVYLPGSISGVLYRDNNANGVFDAGTDTPAPGLPVALYPATGAQALADTITSASGAFSFGTLRPGAYRVVVTPLPTMQIVGGDTIAVTVVAQNPLALPVLFTGNLLSTVAAVRAQPAGSVVAFEGIATVGVGIFSTSTTGNQFNVQDASGAGILILQVPLSSGIQAGDSVRVVGTTAVSAGELLVTSNPTITRLAAGRTVPAPRVVTAAQVAASTATDPLQGLLVKVGGVVVDSVQGGTAAGYNVYASDGANHRFIVRVSTAAVGIARSYWIAGRTYDVTGLLGNFNGAQLKVRSPADVVLRSVATSIGNVRAAAFADSAGTRFDTVTVEAVVHTAQGTFRTDNAFIQDATGGILLFNVPAGAGLAVGDSIRVTAAIDWFNGELELVRFSSSSPPVIEDLGTGAMPLSRTISGLQFLSRSFEGQLIRLGSAVVDSVGAPTSAGAYTAFVTATDGSELQVRIEKTSIGIPGSTWVVGSAYDVVGALSHFRGVPQVKPRSAADVTAGAAGVLTIAAAEARPAGDTVTVEGVVTAPVGIFGSATGSTINAYIADGSGGIQIFGVPPADTLTLGDLVRVTGVMGAFSRRARADALQLQYPAADRSTGRGGGTGPAPGYRRPGGRPHVRGRAGPAGRCHGYGRGHGQRQRRLQRHGDRGRWHPVDRAQRSRGRGRSRLGLGSRRGLRCDRHPLGIQLPRRSSRCAVQQTWCGNEHGQGETAAE